jgi:hypothetical protein
MYLKRNSLFISSLSFLFLSLILASNFFSQTRKYQKATVIVTVDYLRELPISSAPLKTSVRKGAKLNVIPAATRGWYLGYEEGVFIIGYIHGNSIRLDAQQTSGRTKEPKTPKNVPVSPPKYIVLDIPPNDGSSAKKVKKGIASRPPSKPNLCLPPLYCPDIEEVQTMLLTNSEKFEKGKFEKTADWEKRLPTVLSEFKLSEGHTASEKMIFLYEQGTGTFNINDPEYDADRELWSFPMEVKVLDPILAFP